MNDRARTLSRLRGRRLAVLMGGWSGERNISLQSGQAVGDAMARLGLRPAAIDVTPRVADDLRRRRVDLAFLVTHGPFGEDGRLQGLLDMMRIPYTGSGVLASALAMHKPTAKRVFEAAGLPTPRWAVFRRPAAGTGVAPFRSLAPSLPRSLVVKPASQGSALGVRLVDRPADWPGALRAAWRVEPEALAEERIAGTEITVGILDGKALPVVEIVPAHAFYDFHSKYAPGGSRHLVPARLPETVRRKAQQIALAAHRALGCRHVSRVDLIVDRRRRPWILEVNTLPGMTGTSLLPDAAQSAGLSFDDLVLELLRLALRDAHAAGNRS